MHAKNYGKVALPSRNSVPLAVAALLEERARSYPRKEYFQNDPVHLAHAYPKPEDREIAALLAALLAFGKAKAFLPKIRSLLEVLGKSPVSYVLDYEPSKDPRFFRSFRSRIYRGDDLRLLLSHLRLILSEHSTLEDAFLNSRPALLALDPSSGSTVVKVSHRARLAEFARLFYRLDPRPITGSKSFSPGYRHLVTDPEQGSACKRWNLFLRWVVRPADGVDLGLWKRVDPADLVIPLDVHIGRISRLVGLRRRRTPDWKAAEEVTERLRAIDPRDPVRFDFPLSHLGISEECRGRWVPRVCRVCKIALICRVGKRHLEREE